MIPARKDYPTGGMSKSPRRKRSNKWYKGGCMTRSGPASWERAVDAWLPLQEARRGPNNKEEEGPLRPFAEAVELESIIMLLAQRRASASLHVHPTGRNAPPASLAFAPAGRARRAVGGWLGWLSERSRPPSICVCTALRMRSLERIYRCRHHACDDTAKRLKGTSLQGKHSVPHIKDLLCLNTTSSIQYTGCASRVQHVTASSMTTTACIGSRYRAWV
jgi:hypothetical protein